MPKQQRGRVVIIHGVQYRQRDRDNLRKLAVAFRAIGFCIVMPTYGYIPAFVVGLFSWLDDRIADSMSAFIREGDILLGHSNGGTLTYLISKRTKIGGAILVNPALDPSLCPEAPFIQVYYNNGDWVSSLAGMVPFNIWGNMGSAGYLGSDPRVTNIDCGNPPDGLPPLQGHSDVFSHDKIRPWARYMAEKCVQALESLTYWKHHD